MSKEKRYIKESKKIFLSPFKDFWKKRNYLLIGAGLITLIVGYILMAQGEWDSFISLSISPIILLVGYLIIIPLAIFFKLPKSGKKETDVPS